MKCSMRFIQAALGFVLAAPLWAQSNAIPGLDVRAYDIGDIGVYGRRGAAYPNGDLGFGIGHSFCNAGTANITWVASGAGGVMLGNFPRIAYLLARESGGRMVQISGKSHMKHSRFPFNFSSGPCAPCNLGSGSAMFPGCSDTYGSGGNIDRMVLGPSTEIDPWLGTWNMVGSYFDRGDPAVSGPAATDSVQSLTSAMTSAFDAVKNRVEVREADLAGGGRFFAQIQLNVVGEPSANRSNNTASRPCNITWNGSAWNASMTGSSSNGSVLMQWSGALMGIGQNGLDDGRFLVAVKVTGPTAGIYHYEYAVHNLDNNRGAAALHIPMPAAATVSNSGFRDIDTNPLNDWTFVRGTNEVVFNAAAGNPVDWNTIYNFWFDATQAPPLGPVTIDQARIGPGALSVVVDPTLPTGLSPASTSSLGVGCGGCRSALYEFFSQPTSFDLANSSMTLAFNGTNYSASVGTLPMVPPTGTPLALGDDTEVNVTLPFSLPYPGGTTTLLRVCSNGFISPAASNGTSFVPDPPIFLTGAPRWAAAWHDFNPGTGGQVLLDSTPTGVRVTWVNVNNFSGGGTATFQYEFLPSGTVRIVWGNMTLAGNTYLTGWSPGAVSPDPGPLDISGLTTPVSLCAQSVTTITLAASAAPVLGTTIAMQTTAIPAGSAFAALVLSFSRAVPPIDLTSLGMPGCFQHTVGGAVTLYITPGSSVSSPLAIPSSVTFAGLNVIGQSFSYSPPLTPLGVISSNGLSLFLGPP
jgi:hypothetical protein